MRTEGGNTPPERKRPRAKTPGQEPRGRNSYASAWRMIQLSLAAYPVIFAAGMWAAHAAGMNMYIASFAVSAIFVASVVHMLAPAQTREPGENSRPEEPARTPGGRTTVVRTSLPSPFPARSGPASPGAAGGGGLLVPLFRATLLVGSADLPVLVREMREHAGPWNTDRTEDPGLGQEGPARERMDGATIMIEGAGEGLHHSLQEEYWRRALAETGRQGARLLATTQSADAIQAFAAAAAGGAASGDDAAVVRISAPQGGQAPQVTVFDQDDLARALAQGQEIR